MYQNPILFIIKCLFYVVSPRRLAITTLLEAALDYASRGMYVFPVREKDGKPYRDKEGRTIIPRAKQPYSKPGLHGATTDKRKIKQLWATHPNAGIGLNCGMSNLFAIDIDTHKGSGGLSNFMKMGISYDGAWQGLTPYGGLHIIYSGKGRTSTNENLQIDTRGKNGYIIVPPSWIIDKDGDKLHYTALGEWTGIPAPLPPDIFKRLGLEKSRNGVSSKYNDSDETSDELYKRVKKWSKYLTGEMAFDYETWVRVGMSLYGLGERGFEIWEGWTEKYFALKPSSKRVGTLERKWDSFHDTRVTIGTYFWYVKNNKK